MTSQRDLRRVELTRVRQTINELREQLAQIPAGVESVSIDGTSTKLNRKAILDELSYWNRQAALLSGRRERIATIKLNNAF